MSAWWVPPQYLRSETLQVEVTLAGRAKRSVMTLETKDASGGCSEKVLGPRGESSRPPCLQNVVTFASETTTGGGGEITPPSSLSPAGCSLSPLLPVSRLKTHLVDLLRAPAGGVKRSDRLNTECKEADGNSRCRGCGESCKRRRASHETDGVVGAEPSEG